MSNDMKTNTCNRFQYRENEYFAKLILENFDSSRYFDLLLKDKPDLWCLINNIGIEVIDAINEKHRESEKLWLEIPNVERETQEKCKKTMFKNGYEYQGGVQSWGCVVYDNGANSKPYDIIYKSLEKKLIILNKKQYKNFLHYELFINSVLEIKEEWCKDILENCKSIYEKFDLKYERIIIFSQIYFVLIDFVNESYIFKEFSNNILNKISKNLQKKENFISE